MKTTEELFNLPTIDIDTFLDAMLLDEDREAYTRMNERQKFLIRKAIRYGQMQVRKHHVAS